MSSERPRDAVQAELRKFPCPQCGAEVLWAPGRGRLRCDYCGYEQAVAGSNGGGQEPAVPEQKLESGLARPSNLGWGAERKAVRCTKCGAVETFDAGVAARHCAFCGTAAVVEAPNDPDLVRPEGVLPFAIERNDALNRFRGWLRSLWFRPNDLAKRAALTGIQGLYVPVWTFDADSRSRWSAESGTRHGTGKNARVTWRPVSGVLDYRFDDLPVPASRGLDDATARALEPFPTERLARYDPSYLAGFFAEEYAVGLAEAHSAARLRMDETLRRACRAEVPGDECRNLRVETIYSDWRYKSGLVPVWIAAYEYAGKSFRYIVNGVTGKATGSAPWSWAKISIAVAVALVVLGIILSN